jgi:hypothetical protein
MEEVLPAWRTSFPSPKVRIDGQKVSSWNEVVMTRWTSVLSADRMRPLRASDLTMRLDNSAERGVSSWLARHSSIIGLLKNGPQSTHNRRLLHCQHEPDGIILKS